MEILSWGELLANAQSEPTRRAREIALKLLKAGVEAADPKACVKSHVRLEGGKLKVGGEAFNLSKVKRIFVVGGGKASGAMAEALEEILGERIDGGIVNVPRGSSKRFKTGRIRINEAGHPIPDEQGVEGVRQMVKLLEEAGGEDLVFALISGGGSALMPLPAEGLTLADKQEATGLLLRSGAPIQAVNTVRKHLSAIKGGRMALKAYPARLIALIISDVVGDRLDHIASGPTVPDPTTYGEALEACRRYRVLDRLPTPVRRLLEDGGRGILEETPKPGNPAFTRTLNLLVGTNRKSCLAMVEEAGRLGVKGLFLTSTLEGEARHVGTVVASILQEAAGGGLGKKPLAIILGGETTVTVRGRGKGGRSQELALSSSKKLRGLEGVALAAMGSDGIDGFTDAAGAVVDGYTAERAERLGLDLDLMLDDNDSYHFFSKLGDLIFTGLTGTNVNDFIVLVAV
ncbi:MAG: glycerate kinase [Candidatus Hecatellales archaeon]|nr:MAG: glycerate kinase [Candidatus Hecatellales archaeon]